MSKMSNDAERCAPDEIELNEVDNEDLDLTGTSTTSSDCDDEQDDKDASSNESSDLEAGSEKEERKSTQTSTASNSNALAPDSSPAPAAVSSMAYALNMIRRKREEQEREAEEKEKQLEAQRLERAREKRRRRRQNQRQRKAQLKLQEGSNTSEAGQPDGVEAVSSADAPEEVAGEKLEAQAKLEASAGELKRSANGGVEEDNDAAMLKRLPVKKRIKLENSKLLSAQVQAIDPPINHSDSEPLPSRSGPAPSGTSGPEERADVSPSKRAKIDRLIPRALLIKMSQSRKQP